MPVPISQAFTICSYVIGQRLKGNKYYPLVLMLEPLFRCNLECAGCGKIQYPEHVLQRRLTPEQCFRAADECGAPVISLPGGEPLIHPEIKEIVEGLIARKKYVYLCTNALLLKRKMDLFSPSKYLTFSVHLDGMEEEHDQSVCREGTFKTAVEAIQEALKRGFRVTTNTTLFEGANPERVREYFDYLTKLGVEGMMLSPGYSYSHSPDQKHFLHRNRTHDLFNRILANPKKGWQFNQSPLFLEFLMGHRDYNCTPWGMPTYNIFGWQKPCYLLQDGYARTFKQMIAETDWSRYGHHTGNPQCRDCMVHSGYESSAVNDTFGSWEGFVRTVKLTLFGGLGEGYRNGRQAELAAQLAASGQTSKPAPSCGCGCATGERKEPAGTAKPGQQQERA